jgi:hypothetical protein
MRSTFSSDIAHSSWYICIMPILGAGMGEWVWCVNRMLLMVKPKYSGKTWPNATVCTTDLTWTCLGLSQGLCIERLMTDCLRHGMVLLVSLMLMHWILNRIVVTLKVYTPSYCVANHVVHPLLQEDQLRKLETLFHSQVRLYKHLFLLFHFYLVCQNERRNEQNKYLYYYKKCIFITLVFNMQIEIVCIIC